jgi:hypothetical protein
VLTARFVALEIINVMWEVSEEEHNGVPTSEDVFVGSYISNLPTFQANVQTAYT